MENSIGVLMYHCTQYGKVDFYIQGCVEGLFNALSSKFDKEELLDGFIAEAANYMETDLCKTVTVQDEYGDYDQIEELDLEKVKSLFNDVYEEYI